MRKIIAVALATLLMSFAFVTPANAARKQECDTIRGDWGSARFCLVVKYREVAGHGSPDWLITKTKLVMRSSLTDSELGYLDMHNIDFSAREVVSGDWIHLDFNNRTETRRWVDPHMYLCIPQHCRFTVNYTIGWGPAWPNSRETITFVLRKR